MTQTVEANKATPSRLVAREIRAELGRQQLSQRRLALLMGATYQWVQRRLSIGAELELTVDDAQRIADALGVPVAQLLSGWVDHTPSPSGGSTLRSPQDSNTLRDAKVINFPVRSQDGDAPGAMRTTRTAAA